MIELKNVNFGFDEELILENVNISINKGDLIGIIGPNGGGKTTLLKLIMGFLKPQSGKISLLGKDPEEMRHQIGYVPQNSRYDHDFPISVIELVLSPMAKESKWFGRYPAHLKEKACSLLEELGLIDYRNRNFGDLSGGLAQRALIARSLIDDPEILLLDEPTSNIDPKTRTGIYEYIYSLKGKKTILMVTHDLNTIIENVKKIFCVEKEVSCLLPKQVCEHFALGLYHTPLRGQND